MGAEAWQRRPCSLSASCTAAVRAWAWRNEAPSVMPSTPLPLFPPHAQVLMRAPPTPPGPSHVLFDHFWVETGGAPLPEGRESDGGGGSFVLTPAVQGHLRNLARAVLLRRYPILLQVPPEPPSPRCQSAGACQRLVACLG